MSKKYVKMDFGFNECNVQWGSVHENVNEADMVKMANDANANGFRYSPTLNYGALLVGEYPKGCKSPVDKSWPLYLAE